MSKILLGLAAFFLLCSAGLSFVNKGKLSTSLDDARGAHQDATAAHAEAAKNKTAMNKALADTKEATQKAADAQTQYAAAQSQVTELTAKIDQANKATADKDAQLAALNQKLADATKNIGPTAPGQDIAQKIDELQKQRDELQVVKDGMEAQLKTAQNQLAASAKREQDRQTGVSMVGLQGRVLAVDRNWNFVVLNIGDRSGVNNNATMVVQRGGSLVGKVRITSVEPSQSIADIIPNSVPAGISVQAGDTVVFPGS